MATLYTPEPQRQGLDWLSGMVRDGQQLWQNQARIEQAKQQLAMQAQQQRVAEEHFWTTQERLKKQEDFQNQKFLYDIRKDQDQTRRQGILDTWKMQHEAAQDARADETEARLGAPSAADQFFNPGGTPPPFPESDTPPPTAPEVVFPKLGDSAPTGSAYESPKPNFLDVPVRRAEPVTESSYLTPPREAENAAASLGDLNAPTRAPNGGPALLLDNTEISTKRHTGGLYDLAPGSPLPPGKIWAKDGSIWTRKFVGGKAQNTLYEEAGPPPPKDAWPEDHYPVPVLNEGTNVPKSYKYEKIPKIPKESQAALGKAAELIAKNDPEFVSLSTSAAEAEGALAKAKVTYAGLSRTDDAQALDRKDLEPHIAQLAESARVLKEQAAQKLNEIRMQALRQLNPNVAKAFEQYHAAVREQDTTPPTPAAAPLSTADKFDTGLNILKTPKK